METDAPIATAIETPRPDPNLTTDHTGPTDFIRVIGVIRGFHGVVRNKIFAPCEDFDGLWQRRNIFDSRVDRNPAAVVATPVTRPRANRHGP